MKKIYLLLLIVLFAATTNAQVANYNFAASSGTYTTLAASTNVFSGAWDDNTAISVPIGFTFTFNGVGYTSVFVHPNGYLTFGTSTSGYTPISGGSAVAGVVSAYGRDLQSQNTAPLGSVDYSSAGGVFTAQWSNTRRYNSTTVNAERFEMQIQLVQTTNVVRFVYGTWSDAVNASNTTVGEVGLRGTSGTDFKNLSVLSGGSWAAPAAGAVNTATIFYNESNVATKPAVGQTYTFSPPPPCVAPANQPTSFVLTAISTSQINGSFTAAAGAPDGYLVVRYPAGASPTNPVNATTYAVGNSLGTGKVVASGAGTSFSTTGLTPATAYDFYAYSYTNNALCSGGPVYNITTPLFGTKSTLACGAGLAGGTYTVGPTGTYPSVTAVIAALSNGTTGPVIFELQGTYTSAVETFPITFPGIACPMTGTVTVRPQTGAVGLTITSADPTATIDVNGANYLIIDGRPGGTGVTSQLTISNTATGTAVDIRFINDAVNNTITYCTLLGSTSTTFGVVTFSTGVTTGNDGNTISNNSISAAGANLPLNGIYSLGTSAAIDNSGNTITANNIFDYFNAGSATNGMNINSNNSAWTITSNRLYQTATRVYTIGNAHRGINITSGSGYTITGNIIGYANNTATGTTNMVGNSVTLAGFPGSYVVAGTANATTYVGISCAFTAAGTMSEIQNNTIAGFALYTSSSASTTTGIFCGIAVTSGNANIGTTTGNTIGATTGNSSIYTCTTTTGGIIAGIYASSSNAIAIRNNTVGALDAMGTTATVSGGINGINIAGASTSYDVSGNTIGNSTNPSLRMGNLTTGANLSNVGTTFGIATGTGQFNGILSTETTAGTIGTAALPNTVRNASLNSSSTSASIRGITASGIPTISNNSINNITSQTTNVGVASTLLGGMGIFLSSISSNGAIVRNNTINSLSLTNPTATGTNITAIAIYAGNSDLYANKIFDITNASTSVTAATPGTACGFFLRQPAGVINIYNNMVSLGNGQTTNTSFNGIWQQNSVVAYTLNAYFNSINIEGVAAAGAQPSFGLNRGSYSATQVLTPVNILDNIFTNTRSGGTGKHYAIANNYAAAASATGWGVNASNYNVLNATAATVGYWGADMTFAGWQAASASDVNSLSAVTINYVNTAIGDLHITTPFPSIVEGAGVDVPLVTTDFDGQTRATLSPVDIGADAGNFSNSPSIVLTALANTCVTGARTLSTTITDPDGVPTSGIGLPVLYWRINAGAYTPVTAIFVSGSQYNFTFGAGAAVGDAVSYYIAAQDNLANVGTSPAFGASGFTPNPPAASTPPSAPYAYSITPTLSGTYTVGVGGNYTTITAAAAAYSNSCLGGPVIFRLIDATYPSETFPINFNSNPGASAVNTLTIKPAGTTTISGSTLSTIIQINGGDYITIDGSAGNTVNSICPPLSASRDLTIQNTNTTSFAAVVWLNTVASPVNGVTNCTVKNCIVIGGSNVNTAAGIGIGALPLISGGIDNDFNRIENNDIQLCRFGIYVVGQSGANKDDGNVISQNIMTAASPNNIGEGGIFSAYENNLTVSGNQIDNIIRTGSPDSYGINLGFGITNGFSATTAGIADAIGNATITFNKIGAVTNSGTFSAVGLAMSNTVSGTQLIANNTISGVAANGTAGDFATGLWLNGGTGTTNVYHNTVAMQGVQPGASSGSQTSSAFGVLASSSALTIRNNIFVNTQGGGVAGTTTRYAAVSLGYASPYTGFIASNNDLYSAGAGPGTYTTGITGGVVAGTSRVTLADWQTETGQDANSKNVNPVFVSATDLHLVTSPAGTNWCLNSSGINIPAVTNDIDCQARTNPPDIGADEFVPTGDATATPPTQTICSGATITTIVLAGTATSYNWTRDNPGVTGIAASGSGNISGALTNATTAPVTVTFTITPVDASGCFGPSITATVLVNPAPNAVATPSAQAVCSGNAIATIALTGNIGGTVFNWTRDNPGVTGIAASGAGNISGTLVNATASPITVTFTITPSVGGCPGTPITATVTVNPVATISGTLTQPTTCVSTDGAITLVLGGAAGPYTFAWTGPGVNPTSQNQTNLAVGLYNVTVTAGNGCTSSASFGLAGPGGCSICPVVPTLTTNPANAVCLNSNVTLTASGLLSMGVTYGITFKYSTVALADPYVGGTVIATVPNAGLTSGGTVATTTTTFAAAGTYFTYAILSPTPADPLCRPFATANLIVNPIPTVNAVTNMELCAGALATATFSGSVPGTVFNWTNSNAAIGLAASGSGNLSFTATNAGVAPIVATITVTPSYTNGGTTCTGTPTSFTITVNPTPTVNAIANQSLCQGQPTAAVNFTGTPAGVQFQWTNSNTAIGLAAGGLGNIPSFITTNNTAAPITGTITVTPVTGLNGPVTTTFNYTGAVQTFTVPAGITSVSIKTWGAQGNSNAGGIVGGLGGYAEGNLVVVPGQVLNVLVGGGAASSINGGFNGGGAAGINSGCAAAQGGGGGGASDVRTTPYALANRVIVGAGGGGAGGNRTAGCGRGAGGGGGGGLYGGGGGAGWPGIPGSEGPVPTGGTQAAGGAGGVTTFSPGPTSGFPGVLGVGGAGGTEIGSAQGTPTGPAEKGGIGGGLIGGSGLYNNANNWNGQSGAGGSSYIGGVSAGLTTPGLRTGNGLVTITYTPPSATTCFGTPRTFTITVNPNPSLYIVADPGSTLCQGDPALLTVRIGTSTPVSTLYNQPGVAGNGSPSQVFEPANTPFNSQSADDFTVPAGTVWTVSRVTADGIGGGIPTSVNVFFYNNSASNLPGTLVSSQLNIASFVQTGGNYNVTLPTAVALTPGTYWVSVQVNMSFATGGQWFWGNFGAANIGNQYAWQNPGGGFGTPCASWGYGATGCNVGGGVNRNNIFSIVGTSLADGGPLPGGYTFLWSPAAGLSSTTTNPVAASPMTTTTYTVNVNTAQGCTNTASILITVNLRPTITAQPASRTNCVGTTATFSVTGTGTTLAYQWQLSTTGAGGPWTNVPTTAPYFGGTTATLTINPVTLAMNNNQYRCVLTGVCAPIGTANISNPAVLTVNPLPTVTVTPTVSCGSTTANCTPITASGADTYVWTPAAGLFLDCAGTIPYVAGSSAATVYARPTAFTVYTVTGSLSATGCNSSATAIVNYTPPAPTVTPSAVAMCLGDAAVMLVSSSATSTNLQFCSGPISVIVPDANLAGSSSTLTVSGIPAACNVSAMSVTWNMPHTWDGDVAIVLKSPNGAVLNLDYFLSGTGFGPTTGFVNTTVSSTGTAALSSGVNPFTGTFKADAAIGTGAFGPSGPTAFPPTVTTWAPLYANPNGVWTLAMYDGFGGDQGTLTSWCLNFTYVCGVPSTPATWSPIAGLYNDALASIPYLGTPRDTVWTRPTPAGVYNYTATVNSLPPPPITFTNPAPITVTDNAPSNPSPANLVVSGLPTAGVAVSNVNINGFSHTWSGDVNIVLQNPAGTQNVILKGNSAGGDPLVVANGVNLVFSDAATGSLPTTSPMASGTYKPTNYNPSPFTFLAPGPAGVVTPVFPASPLLSTFTGNMNGTWKLYVEDRVGGDAGSISGGYSIGFALTAAACTSPARTVVVTVNAPTTITTQPVSRAICTDKVATFTVVAGGSGPFNYQWQVSTNSGNTWNNIANGGFYAGVTTATLTVTAPPVSMSGYQYRCVITGAAPCASAISFQAMLTVNPLPTIVISASPYTSLFPGLRTTLSSTVSPVAASQYTWLRNGSPVAGAITGTLAVNVDGLGDYTLRVTDANGCTNTSNQITIKDSVSGKCFIYPNPNNGQFQVRYYSTASAVLPRSLTVYDAKGSRVMTQYYTIGRPYDRMDVDLRKYGKGLYWVEIGDMNGNRLTMCRLVIE